MKKTIIPSNYQSKLNLYETQTAIGFIKNVFQHNLGLELNLKRVTAPLFVLSETGINDGLNGEKPVTFNVPSLNKQRSEEHTSELQSRPHLVCRLLLEKKKIIT